MEQALKKLLLEYVRALLNKWVVVPFKLMRSYHVNLSYINFPARESSRENFDTVKIVSGSAPLYFSSTVTT